VTGRAYRELALWILVGGVSGAAAILAPIFTDGLTAILIIIAGVLGFLAATLQGLRLARIAARSGDVTVMPLQKVLGPLVTLTGIFGVLNGFGTPRSMLGATLGAVQVVVGIALTIIVMRRARRNPTIAPKP
jgi:hypothetical protein